MEKCIALKLFDSVNELQNLLFNTHITKEGSLMDLKQIEYILKIAEEKNITHAAEKLFITQSALNQQLLKLE